MANFDASKLALKMIAPNNDLKLDDKGMPSCMVYIPKFRLCDVLSTSDTSIHPAFRVNGAEISGFWFGKYQSHFYNGRAYSLPCEDPSAYTTFDNTINVTKAKGEGWHEATNAEWAAVALWCHKNGTEPKGNNNFGKDSTETLYKAIPTYMSGSSVGRVATGTGPVTWSHDGTLAGIWDMNGNVWEWVTGLRLVYGEVQIFADNNAAASGADHGASSAAWKAIDAATGNLVTPDGNGTTAGTVKLDWQTNKFVYSTTFTGTKGNHDCDFQSLSADGSIGAAAKLLLQALALLPDTALTGAGIDATYGGDHVWANTAEAERCPRRGGDWYGGTHDGVFSLILGDPRSGSSDNIGGRSAFLES